MPAVSVVLPLWRPHDEISTTASSDRDHRCPLTPTFIPWTCQTLELSMACPHTYPRTTSRPSCCTVTSLIKVKASKDTASPSSCVVKTTGLACALCEEFKDRNAPRTFMGKFGLGNVLGVDADARQLVEVPLVPLRRT